MTTHDTPHDGTDVLRKAAELIDQDGRWIQSCTYAWHGGRSQRFSLHFEVAEAERYCAEGAIGIAARQLTESAHEWNRLVDDALAVARRHIDGRPLSMVNDRSGQSASNVADLLRAAADNF